MTSAGRSFLSWAPRPCCWSGACSRNAQARPPPFWPRCKRLNARNALTHTINNLALVRRLSQQARPYWRHLLGILLLSLLSPPLALLTPLPLKIVLDNIIGTEPLPRFLSQ